MEFWGIEVKPGQTVRSEPGQDHILRLSLSALGESEGDQGDAAELTTMFLKLDDGEKMAIGSLSVDKFPQVKFDHCIEKGFELSHTSKTDSVFFCGYRVYGPSLKV